MKDRINKKSKSSKSLIIYNIVMSFVLICAMFVGSFAYWKKESEVKIPTFGFNATEEEFSYYACVPNLAANTGYDYYDIDYIPEDLVNRVTGLACVRYEALTKTAYIPPYPVIRIHGKEFNSEGNPKLPVIHLLNSVQINDSKIDNGFLTIENLIIPDTITFIQPGSFNTSTSLTEVSFLGDENSGNVFYDHKELEGKDVRYQHPNRNIVYRIEAESKKQIKMMQFMAGGELEFENSSRNFVNYIIPNQRIYTLTVEEVDNNTAVNPVGPTPKVGESVPKKYETTFNTPLEPNNIYKLKFDRKTKQLTADKYTYELEITGIANPIPLTMTTNGGYESYYLEDNTILGIELGCIKIEDPNATVEVYEKINDNRQTNPETGKIEPDSIFELSEIQTDYNITNNMYHIRYSPINVYATRHYKTTSDGKLTSHIRPKQIAVEKAYFLNKVIASTEADGKTPVLIQDRDVGPVLMSRNYANEDFEEYYYYDYNYDFTTTPKKGLTGSYIVSNTADPNAKFGGLPGDNGDNRKAYYGIINESSPLGEKVLTDQNMVLFTPDRDRHYGENGQRRHFAIFDEYNHLIQRLSFNEDSSIKNGTQRFEATIPITKKDFTTLKVLEIYENGEIKGDPNNPFYQGNIDELGILPKEDLSSYVAPFFLCKTPDEKPSNMNGFIRTEIDANRNVYYLFEDAYIEKDKLNYVQENIDKINTKKVNFANKNWDLPFQVISGFFYSCDDKNKDVYLNDTRDAFSLPKTGYYDLMIRERTINKEKNLFIGFKYKGTSPRDKNNYFLQQLSGNEVIFTKEMTRTNNHFLSFVDFNADNNDYTYTILDYNGTNVKSGIKFEGFEPGYQRLYFGEDFFINYIPEINKYTKTRHPHIHLNSINVSFSFPGTMVKTDEPFYSGKGFPELIKSSANNEYVMHVQEGQDIVMLESPGRKNKLIGYAVVTDTNKVLKLNNDPKFNGTVPFPGVYKVIYDKTNKEAEYTKIQKPRFYNLYLDQNKTYDPKNEKLLKICSLLPNPGSENEPPLSNGQVGPDKYLEFKSPEFVNINEEIQLSSNFETKLSIRSETLKPGTKEKEYVIINTITSVTLDGGISEKIPKGTYEIYYSIDSTRRKGDKYQVFTKLRLISKPTASVTYHYMTETSENAQWKDYYRQNDATNGTYLLDYSELPSTETSKPINKLDYIFKGWSTTDPNVPGNEITLNYPLYDETTMRRNKITVPKNGHVDLYPIFEQKKHKYLPVGKEHFDSTGYIQFTVSNIEGSKIIGATLDESKTIFPDDIQNLPKEYTDNLINNLNNYIYTGKNFVEDNNRDSNNVITIDLSLCEILGYQERKVGNEIKVGHAIKVELQDLETNLTYFVTVYVENYPKFEFVEDAFNGESNK